MADVWQLRKEKQSVSETDLQCGLVTCLMCLFSIANENQSSILSIHQKKISNDSNNVRRKIKSLKQKQPTNEAYLKL